MRGAFIRRRHSAEEEESAFVSMTDLTIGFLFIVILLLAFFANQYDPAKSIPLPVYETVKAEREAALVELRAAEGRVQQLQAANSALSRELELSHQVAQELREKIAALEAEIVRLKLPNPLETYINQSLVERRRVLETLREKLKREFPEKLYPGLDFVLSEESDALRIQGDGLFRSGEKFPREDRAKFIESLSTQLNTLLPCYTLGENSRWSAGCNEGFALIEAVQIEGHTDSDGSDFNNLNLSTARANNTFKIMTDHEPRLLQHLNYRGQTVMSVAGYGKMRPIALNESVEGKAANRRIDLRIIMYVPKKSEEIEVVREKLTSKVLP